MKSIKKTLSLLLSFCVLFCSASFVFAGGAGNGAVSDNAHGNNYAVWAQSVNSHLYETDGGFTRVEYLPDENRIIAENYDSSFSLLSSSEITAPLPLFGGFYCGEKYNFIVFGQANPTESDSTEVIRIVKYSKSWQELDSLSVFGANTSTPFVAGSMHFAESGDILYIYTCHEIYKSARDGRNHQANMLIALNCETMTQTYINCGVSNIGTGYVSHSFNQLIAEDKSTDSLITLDHGDAYPRAVVLLRYNGTLGSDSPGYPESVNIYNIPGEEGLNATGVSVGGLAVAENTYLTAFNSVDFDGSFSGRNIYVSVTPKNSFTESGTRLIKITDYADNSPLYASTPHLIDLKNGNFMLMWEIYEKDEYGKYLPKNEMSFVIIDENGNKLTSISACQAVLSDCEPIVSGNKVIWYASQNSAPVFMSIDINSPTGVTIEECGHIFSDKTVSTLSCTHDGKVHRTCIICGYEYDEITYSQGHTDENSDGICDICGGYIPTAGNTTSVSWDKQYYSPDDETATLTVNCGDSVYITAVTIDAPFYSYTGGGNRVTFDISGYENGTYDVSLKLSDGQAIEASFTVTDKEIIPDGTTAEITTAGRITETTEGQPIEITTAGQTTEPPAEETTAKQPDGQEILLGDVDLSGKISAADARLALRISAKLDTPDEKSKTAADVNLDGTVTAADARLILRYSARLISKF